MQKKQFSDLGLSPESLKAIARIGFEEASPIQSLAIPRLLAGEDIVGLSQTGSGKTAAFALPAIELVVPQLRAPQVLILCPTRELAMQVAEEVSKLAFFKRGVRELPIYGGSGYDRQLRGLHAGAQIIIGTPGRIMDHLERGSLKLDQIKMVVLDEADRMLDMGFRDDIDAILKQAPSERQTVFFSATLPSAIQQLIKRHARNAVNVRVESHQMTVPAIEQVYYEVDRRSKIEVLCRLIDLQDIKYGLIFCATKMMVDELADHLAARGYSSDKLHGGISQATRERVMAKFRKRGVDFLVATDVAARGLDVDDIEVVFNYDLPQDAEDYVHRIGRTGRAGRSGRAITFVAGREIYKLEQIARFTKARIKREKVPSAEQVEAKRTNQFFDTLRETLERGGYAHHDDLVDELLEHGYSPTEIASALIDILTRPKAPAATPRSDEARPSRVARPALAASDAEPDVGTVRERPTTKRRAGGLPFESPPSRREMPVPVRKEPRAAAAVRERAEPVLPDPSDEAFESMPRRIRREALRTEKRTTRRRDRSEEVSPVSHEAGMARLMMNIGKANGVGPGDVVGVIAGLAKVNREDIGAIELRDHQTYVDVAEDYANQVLKKLKGIRFKGRKLVITTAAS